MCTGFWCGILRTRGNFEDLDADRTIILKGIFKKCDGAMDWTDLAQETER